MKSAIVLGAGISGVSTALALQDRGWAVTLVDRKAPGRETSFGNAGIIQSEAVEPYAMPRSIRELVDIAFGQTNDVFYAFRELPFHIGALFRYWWHSEEGRHRAAAIAWASLIAQATSTHEKLIERAGAGNLVRKSGFRVLHRTAAELEAALKDAERKKEAYGIGYTALSASEMAAAEPALKTGGAGAVHWLDSWTVSDPGGLVESYADLFQRSGGRFVHGDAATLRRVGAGWTVMTEEGSIEAEHAVFSLGPWSSDTLKKFGHHFPMVYKRGYHAHYRSPEQLNAPVMDSENGYLLLPMLAGTRITTGAHLARFHAGPAYNQLQHAEESARDLFDLGPRIEDKPWQGTRPCMPDMLPVIGQSQHERGLWMNFGHGHQGFTLGPASADVLATMMDGGTPDVDIRPFRPERY
ncbi:NAD(P)/FAD-dependent oxidoreductase [Rhizobium sp. LjRoot254]|uniref:NAD(P)/FAD-dependent oxidoreductase n=1 Tax=Rhizobium sp. LjRoot254 TaxID=3342297 RepID=UPI003ECE8B6A